MKSGPFIKLVAESYCIPEPTVRLFMRQLREADLITKGPHGRNAPDMTPLDAARITIALLATDRPALAVESYQVFSKLVINTSYGVPDHFDRLGFDHDCDLEELVSDYFTGQSYAVLMDSLEIRQQERTAVCLFEGKDAFFDGTASDVEQIWELGLNRGRKTRTTLAASDMIPVLRGLQK